MPAAAPALSPFFDPPLGVLDVEEVGSALPVELAPVVVEAAFSANDQEGYAPSGRSEVSAAAQRTWTAYLVRVVVVRYEVLDVVEYSPALES